MRTSTQRRIRSIRRPSKRVRMLRQSPMHGAGRPAQGLRRLCQDAMMFYNRVGYHDFEGIAVDLDERDRLGRNLGRHNVLILSNHGLLTCGQSIGQAVVLMHNLVAAAEVQARMEATGQEMCVPSPEV